jgi:catechol 2,3-dioxygenase-like lactoylglutathione lyase family enzyme
VPRYFSRAAEKAEAKFSKAWKTDGLLFQALENVTRGKYFGLYVVGAAAKKRAGEKMEPHFDHVGLNVRDLDEAIRFCRDMFGFELIQRWDQPRQAFVGRGAVVLGLIEQPDYDFRRMTMAHIAFPCEAAAFPAILARVRELGAGIVSGPKPQRGGETILFRDPSGNIFEVCYPAVRE